MLNIYKSSAGSGKTFTLVQEYLKLAFISDENYKKILAITFTNKSAKELKDRIIVQLQKMSDNNIDDVIAESLMKKHSLTNFDLQKKSKKILQNIIYSYDEFAIITIDSFFQLIINNFIHETKLNYEFEYEFNLNYIIENIIKSIYSNINHDSTILESLKNFALNKIKSGKKWHYGSELNTLCVEYFKENFLTIKKNISNYLNTKSDLKSLVEKLHEFKEFYRQKHVSYGKQFTENLIEHGLIINDFLYKDKGVAGYLNQLKNGKIKLLPKRALDILDNPQKWCSKSSEKKELLVHLGETVFKKIVKNIHEFQIKYSRKYYDCILMDKYLYLLNLDDAINKSYTLFKNENNLLAITDIIKFIIDIAEQNEVSFIYEKIGQYFKYFLIDEFQDVSDLQWQVLKPLIKNAVSEGGISMIVGDPKQSIYRWRGANSKLLTYQIQQDFGQQKLTIKYLNKNWRSSQKIIHFNNIFFKKACEKLYKVLKDELIENNIKKEIFYILDNLYKSYDCLEQSYSAFQNDNAIHPDQITISVEEEYKDFLMKKLNNLNNRNIKNEDIAILVRNNLEVKKIQSFISIQKDKANIIKNLNNNFYKNHYAINIIINTLKYLETKDEFYLTVVSYHYVKEDTSNSFISPDMDKIKKNLPKAFFLNISNFHSLHIINIVKKIIDIFNLRKIYNTEINLFLEFVYSIEKNYSIEEFLNIWNSKMPTLESEKQTLSEGIKIMTVHQSKGLEFKAVIMPFCNWEFDHPATNKPIIWCKTYTNKFPPYIPIKYSKDMLNSNFIDDYFLEKMNIFFDNLNLLYVAFTRAKQELHINTQPKSNSIKNVSDLIHFFSVQEDFKINSNPSYGVIDS